MVTAILDDYEDDDCSFKSIGYEQLLKCRCTTRSLSRKVLDYDVYSWSAAWAKQPLL